MKFSKMHGLGNDFVVIDKITQNVYLNPNTIQKLADRNTGIGFDQMLWLEPPYDPDCDFYYRIFNADGSEVGHCGNGARCVALFVLLKKLTNKKRLLLNTCNSRMEVEIKDGNLIKVNMGQPIFEPAKIPFIATELKKTYILQLQNNNTVFCGTASMGNPHCVLVVEDFEKSKLLHLGAEISEHHRFPEKVNVNFMQVLDRQNIKLQTFERGVGFTKACGTGACASVAVGISQGLLDNIVTVQMPGGNLKIEWQGNNEPLFMTGQATHIFDGYIKI